jgi:hypothetical protein
MLDDLEGAFGSGIREAANAFHISGETLLFSNLTGEKNLSLLQRCPDLADGSRRTCCLRSALSEARAELTGKSL